MKEWYNNQSLRVKLTSVLLLLILALQIISIMVFGTVLSRSYEESLEESKRETLKQTAVNICGDFSDIIEQMVFICSELETLQMEQAANEDDQSFFSENLIYEGYFNRMVASGDNFRLIDSMMILGTTRPHYFSMNACHTLKDSDLFETIKKDYDLSSACRWTGIMDGSYFYNENGTQVAGIIMPVKRYGEPRMLLIVIISEEQLREYLLSLIDAESGLLLRTETGEIRAFREDMELHEMADAETISQRLPVNGWTLTLFYKTNEGKSKVTAVTSLLFVILAVGIIISIVGYFVVYTITKPMDKLTRIIRSNGQNREFPERFPVKYRDEVGVMATAYNQMMDEMSQLMEDIRQEQEQNRKNYMKLLQLQIKPHFLYNSLEAARFLADMQDRRAAGMLAALGQFYKLSLSGVLDIVKLREESEHLACYMTILKYRYTSRYDYEILIPEELMDCEIVKFSLQPLVENAVYHGVKQIRRKGFIRVEAKRQGENLLIHIWDNGAGISRERLENIRQRLAVCDGKTRTEHIGMLNVHQRIRMFYAGDYGITVTSQEKEYTDVQILIPIRR